MGILRYRPEGYVDAVIKNDGKLLGCVKKYPILYDKFHPCYGHRKKIREIWDNIARELKCITGDECKRRWLDLIKRYRNETSELHERIIEILDEIFKKINPKMDFIDSIEDDTLSQLFSQPIERQVDRNDRVVPELSMLEEPPPVEEVIEDFYCEPQEILDMNEISENDLCGEAMSLAPSEISIGFFGSQSTNDISYLGSSLEFLSDYTYQPNEDADNYYSYFVDNILEKCNRNSHVFGDVIESLIENLKEDDTNETRKEIVKILCQRLKQERNR